LRFQKDFRKKKSISMVTKNKGSMILTRSPSYFLIFLNPS
jgi:hypothetical protein